MQLPELLVGSVLVALGATVGTPARFFVSGVVARRFGETLPWGTFVVNVSGSLLLGVITGLALYLTAPRPVFACSCINVVRPTCRAFVETPLVFVATAHTEPYQRLSEAVDNPDGSVTVTGSAKPARTTLVVHRTFRGTALAQYRLREGSSLPDGQQFLVFGYPSEKDEVDIGCCAGHTRPLDEAGTEIAYIESLERRSNLGTVAGELATTDGVSASVGTGWKVVLEEEDETPHEATPDLRGHFEINLLRPGRYVLHVYHDGVHIPYTRALLVAPNACPQDGVGVRVPVVTSPHSR